jgi:hypothetical protein
MDADDRSTPPSQTDRHIGRRSFLAGAAAASGGAMIPWAPPGAHAARASEAIHGVQLRGIELTAKNRLAEGRFGAMFKRLPAFTPPDDLLERLARTMVEDQTVPDDEHLNMSPRLSAGFTFIGQFIDHDITFDNTPLDLQEADPDARTNFRTPRFDLDSLYGRGPDRQPRLYDPDDRDKLLVTRNVHGVRDMDRDGGRAIIPESRNDQNLILIQLHLAIARFHNRLVDHVREQGVRRAAVFARARRLTQWYYQWAVIHDFLPRFVGDDLVGPNGSVYQQVAGRRPTITLDHYRPTNRHGRPFMPIEFAGAAYRFGHSTVRPFYVINQTTLDRGGVPTFGADGGFNLNGGRAIPDDLVVDWKNILPVDPDFPARKPRKLDTNLSLPLSDLPAVVIPPPDVMVHLAVRNMLRGKRMGLPSGQRVAAAMRVKRLSNATLGLSNDPGWDDQAPLWYYILKEAELPPYNAERLGPVGGKIVAEVLVGLLQRDKDSYLSVKAWAPSPPIAPSPGKFGFVDLLRFAGAA